MWGLRFIKLIKCFLRISFAQRWLNPKLPTNDSCDSIKFAWDFWLQYHFNGSLWFGKMKNLWNLLSSHFFENIETSSFNWKPNGTIYLFVITSEKPRHVSYRIVKFPELVTANGTISKIWKLKAFTESLSGILLILKKILQFQLTGQPASFDFKELHWKFVTIDCQAWMIRKMKN